MKQNLLIIEYIRKHMSALIAVMMWENLKLKNCEYLDQRQDTGYVASFL